MKKQIEVAAGIIYIDGKFLLSKRKAEQHQGGKWEFPGGKLDLDETPEHALCRELKEELNIDVVTQSHFMSLDFEYPEKRVSLHFQLVTEFTGKEQGVEGQQIDWFSKNELEDLTFPDASLAVLKKIQEIIFE